jgi:hypothetical protein
VGAQRVLHVWLQTHITKQQAAHSAITRTTRHTHTGLRYHPEHHVRVLAAETFGFLLRTAKPRKAVRSGLRAVLAEAAVRSSARRTHGAGLLVAEALLGPEHGLHSRAGAVLGLLLQDDILAAADFGAAAGKAAAAAAADTAGDAAAEQQAAGTPAALNGVLRVEGWCHMRHVRRHTRLPLRWPCASLTRCHTSHTLSHTLSHTHTHMTPHEQACRTRSFV